MGAGRASALAQRIDRIDPAGTPGQARLDALGMGLVDALLACDADALRAALGALRKLRARALSADGASEPLLGWLSGAISFSYWGLERLGPQAAPSVADGTHASDFIEALRGSGRLGSADLRELLGVDDTEVSRSGRRLLEEGLVTRSKVGRRVFWQLTPRGRQLPARRSEHRTSGDGRGRRQAHPGGVGAEFWREAIRQGFEGAAGDEPAMGRRTVDPTRERIIESTLDLHVEHGIRETTFDQVAARAGIPVETIESYFATQDDLVRGCARHVLRELRLPPPERAGEIFSGATTENERLHRLVGTLFDTYERESESLERGRRDRGTVPIVDEALEQVDAAVDALVTEALRPIDPDAETVASVRALTDLEVWRALREAGASSRASVEDASGALERWLGSHGAGSRAPAA